MVITVCNFYSKDANVFPFHSHDSSLKTIFEDQILWLQQVLSYLSTFRIDIAFEGPPLEECSSIQSHIEALIIEAAIMIYSS